jgi:Carboxypeptidase regulatory-like domain/Domain of unknown function (DUF4382)
MSGLVRTTAALVLATALASCSASPGSAPTGAVTSPAAAAITNPPRNSLPKREHGIHPNDQIGGGIGKHLLVMLGDAALPNGSKIQAVNLGIDQILATDSSGNVTTVAQYTSPQVVNVLAYQGGNTTPIADGNVANTVYTSLTIVVDTATSNYVTGGGVSRPLEFAANAASRSSSSFGSSTTTGPGPLPGTVAITFNRAFSVAGASMDVDVDFNALESLNPTAAAISSAASSRPSVSVAQEGLEGSIAGVVQNSAGNGVSNAVVVAVANDGSTAATGVTDASGNFLLHTLSAGSYSLEVFNKYVTASGWSVTSLYSTTSAAASGTTPIQGPSATVAPGQAANVGVVQD